VDPQTVDQNYAQLQQQGQQTASLIQTLAGKLQTAAAAGDTNAREWMLDLKEIALGVQQEEGQVSLLLQSIHSMVDNHVQSTGQPGYQQQGYQQPQYQQQGYQQPQYQQQGGMGGGGMLQSFLGGGFGRAIVSGAGFGIGDDIINKIF
jgi:hypothetical protein